NDGNNGQDGADGITPTLKIENEMWYVSYDNGITWTLLGQATGNPGQNGQDGQNGDSMFTSVTYDNNNVYFTLSDGTVITIPRGNGTEITIQIIDGAIIVPCKVSDTSYV
ncbi:MAG: PL29 family lyase N-terminal domain-containing protein, partial [Bacteroidales bacterium]|nr:PL29 family lyase N-terminal domain-containing protein [Bacteroidales bacterium]